MKSLSVQKNIAFSTLYQVLNMLTPLITAPYTARVLGAEMVGVNSFVGSVQSYFLMFAALGTSVYGSREIARNRDNPEKRSQLFWEIEFLTVITTSICMAVWCLLIAFSKDNKLYYMIMTMNLLAILFDISWFYSGVERFDYSVILGIFGKIICVASIFLFVKSPEHLPRFMAIFAATGLLSNVVMWFFLPQYIRKPNFKSIKVLPHLKHTLVYFIPTVATSVYTMLDKTLIGVITNNNAQNGYYEQATKIINLAKSVAFFALNNVMASRMSYLYAKDEQKEIKERSRFSMEYICFICVGITFGLISVAPRFVPAFFGPDYEEVIPLLMIFSPIVLIIGISNCIAAHYHTPVGLIAESSKFLITGSVVNLCLNLLLIPQYGGLGAAIASVAAELVITVLYVANCGRLYTVSSLAGQLWKKIVAALVMFLVIKLIDGFISSDILALILEVPCGVIVYCLILLAMKDCFAIEVVAMLRKKLAK